MNSKNGNSKSKRMIQEFGFIDLLKGRIPLMDNKVMQFIYFIVVVGFWMFVIWMIGSWTLSIPVVSNLFEFIKNARSP